MLNHQCRQNIYDLHTKSDCWKSILKDAITDVSTLAKYIEIPPEKLLKIADYSDDAAKKFPIFIPKTYAARILKGDINDPLLKQVLPISDELIIKEGFCNDPVGDNKAKKSEWLLQKYHGRTLILTTNKCSINCRFCFRKNVLGNTSAPNINQLESVLHEISSDQSIEEVILSGGEPFILDDNQIIELLKILENIDHLKRIRFHTRMAITIPQRINNNLVDRLQQSTKQVVIITHCNHPNEIDIKVTDKLSLFKATNVTLLNQSVLLKGVNDKCETLASLSSQLFDLGIIPYYLHLLDKAQGAHHFYIPDSKAIEIWTQLQKKLPGYLVPKLVREIAGEPAKTIISK